MPRLEGGPKALSNQLKSKGLQRLRWYCQVCEKQCRDENGFKQHCLSESHVRRLQIVGEDPQKFIRQYTEEFKHAFLQHLRTSHGEKPVQLNSFYQTYIADKQHIHLNATRFSSLTEFGKYLGREGICRVTEEEGKGVFIAWIDNTPDALRRRDALQKHERLITNDEKWEQKAIQAQIDRAWQTAAPKEKSTEPSPSTKDEGVPEVKEVPKFSLPQRQNDVKVESKKRKNVFSSSKRQPGGLRDNRKEPGTEKDSTPSHDSSAKKVKRLDLS